MPRLTLFDRDAVTGFPHRHWRRPAVRLIALLIVAVFVATLIEASTVTRVEALNTTLTVNSDLPHILLKGSPLSDGDCDTIPESLRSILHPPPNTCTLGGALRQLGAIAGHHTIFFFGAGGCPGRFRCRIRRKR